MGKRRRRGPGGNGIAAPAGLLMAAAFLEPITLLALGGAVCALEATSIVAADNRRRKCNRCGEYGDRSGKFITCSSCGRTWRCG